MCNHRLIGIKFSIFALILAIILSPGHGISQVNQAAKPASPGNLQTLTAAQTAQVKKILSGYNASRLTAQDAKAIQENFRQAGIHAGPETNSAIISAGFDPEKLRALAPPPDQGINARPGPPSLDERMKQVEEKISKPLALSPSQKETVNKAFREFYTEMDKLAKAQANPHLPPEKSKVEPVEKARDAKIKQVLSAGQYTKYLELEKSMRPKRPEGKGPGQK